MKKIVSLVILAAMLMSTLVVLPIGVSAGDNTVPGAIAATATPTKIEPTWIYGYMGSPTNTSYPKRLSGGGSSSTYRITEVLTIAEKGTTIYFNDAANFASNNAYVISAWKKDNGGNWVFNDDGISIVGSANNNSSIQKKESDGSMTYTYTTYKDNESIRICYCCTGNKDSSGNDVYPDVYVVKRGDRPTGNNECTLTFNADGTISGVKWESGYIGSDTNPQGHEYKLYRDAKDYAHTDIMTIPKAGTKITFTDEASPFSVDSSFVISSWKRLDDGSWIVDETGPNYNGNATEIAKTDGSKKVYTYVTYKDNEHLRLSYKSSTTYGEVIATNPVVKWETTTDKPTYTPPVEPPEGETYLDVKWNQGYAVISPHNCYGYKLGYTAAGGFAATDVFTVPKKGTRLTWQDTKSGYAYTSVCTVSSWKQENGAWVIDTDEALFVGEQGKYGGAVESAVTNGTVTYTYITSKDNENLRLCISSASINDCPKIKCEQTSLTGTWTKVQALYPAEPSAPVTPVTGTTIDAEVLPAVKWNYGYVGSDTHSSKPNQIVQGSDVYVYSDIIHIEKKGTTIYFFDDDVSDQGGSSYASSNAYVFSFWNSAGTKIDLTLNNIDGAEANSKLIGKHKMYWYTTEQSDMYIRLCYRSGLSDLTLSPHPYNIYVSKPGKFTRGTGAQVGKGTETPATYTTGSGKELKFSIYTSELYTPGSAAKTVFAINADKAMIEALKKGGSALVVVGFDGDAKDSELLIDAVIEEYKLNRYFIYLTGDEQVNKDCGGVFVNYLKDASSSTSADDACNALLSKDPLYYGILSGATMYAMGDSYFAGQGLGKQGTWVNMMGEKYGMHYINYGIGGSTVSDYVTTNNPMCIRFKDMEAGDADVILLEGGRNDRSKLVPLGTNDSRDTKTFLGALNVMIDECLKKYPNALIVLVTPWYNTSKVETGYTNVTYADAIRDLAKYLKNPRVVCLYAADRQATGVDMDDVAFRTKYSSSASDVSHLNALGMALVQPYMEKFIATELAKLRGLDLNGNDPATVTDPVETTDPSTPTDSTDAPIVDTSAPEQDTEPSGGGCGGRSNAAFAYLALALAAVLGSALVIRKH